MTICTGNSGRVSLISIIASLLMLGVFATFQACRKDDSTPPKPVFENVLSIEDVNITGEQDNTVVEIRCHFDQKALEEFQKVYKKSDKYKDYFGIQLCYDDNFDWSQNAKRDCHEDALYMLNVLAEEVNVATGNYTVRLGMGHTYVDYMDIRETDPEECQRRYAKFKEWQDGEREYRELLDYRPGCQYEASFGSKHFIRAFYMTSFYSKEWTGPNSFYTYSKPQSFDIPDPFEKSGMVDLGLSVRWAATYLNADGHPEAFGDCYGYGDPDTKSNTLEGNPSYKWKPHYYDTYYYPEHAKSGMLAPEDDPISVSTKGKQRTPTYEEAKEILDNTYGLRCLYKGIRGWLVRSTVKGYKDKVLFFRNDRYGNTCPVSSFNKGLFNCYLTESLQLFEKFAFSSDSPVGEGFYTWRAVEDK